MKQFSILRAFYIVLLFFATFTFISSGYCAESTADVSVDAELKEKVRQKFLGSSNQLSTDDEYIVGYRDILSVSIYGEGSMSAIETAVLPPASPEVGTPNTGALRGRGSGIEVRMDGRISLRHIGDVSVIGMTLTQIADYLKQLYTEIYDNPSLTVTLVQSNSLQYTVMGKVTTPGLYYLDYPLTVVRAIAKAGGFSEWANFEVTVIRQGSVGKGINSNNNIQGKKFEFDFEEFLKGKNLARNIIIKSGDVIVVH